MAVLAPALVRLRSEINQEWPHRAHGSDGWIGDLAHQRSGSPEAGGSDHNPNQRGVVDALDTDVDGVNCPLIVARAIRHPAVHYVIWNRTIWNRDPQYLGTGGVPRARAYGGVDPHTGHIHVSVRQTVAAENNTTPWGIWAAGATITPVTFPTATTTATWPSRLTKALPVLRSGPTVRRSVRKAQVLLNTTLGAGLVVDGGFGPRTRAAVRAIQLRHRLTVDGVIGPVTWAALVGGLPTLRGPAGASPDTRRAQGLLDVFGAALLIDGVFGEHTDVAVRAVQGRYGATRDGVIGPVTHTILLTR